ncbi:MAG: RNA polymerase sigma factor [Bacteroidia bacterium]|nr:RNA polymerase sigma factor [Bacteroidia bacterium]
MHEDLISQALAGDIHAFQSLFSAFQPALRSYLYRLLADRQDAEDLCQDTFLKAFGRLGSFRQEASLKTWVFQIATNLAWDHLRRAKRWQPDVKAQGKALAMGRRDVMDRLVETGQACGEQAYDMREHISTCFACMGKTLPVEQQVALILKDVYDFSVKETAQILEKSPDVVKHLLQDARHTLMDIFEQRCALVSKTGVCNQCSELNGLFNPKQNRQEALMKLDLVKGSQRYDRERLYRMRARLVRSIDPLESPGAPVQDLLLRIDRMAAGELEQL